MSAGHRITDRLAPLLLVLISLGTVNSRNSQLLAEEASADGANCPARQNPLAESQRINGFWRLQGTENFYICCPTGMDPAPIGRTCESLRAELTRKWLGDGTASQPWTARCYVVVHPSIDSYLREVGVGGKNTLGSSLTKTENGRIISRRIDLRGDVAEPLRAALPHELTHVLLADAFPGETLPRWADEGVAMLADPPEKLARHGQDLRAALATGSALRIGELMMSENYPSADRRAVFYAESASLVGFLVERKAPEQFIAFLRLKDKAGPDAALRKVYGIQDIGVLERLWRFRDRPGEHQLLAKSDDSAGPAKQLHKAISQ